MSSKKFLKSGSLFLFVLFFFHLSNGDNIKNPNSPAITCPNNFIPVPKLKNYTDKDFCVAKYEMKKGENGKAHSMPEKKPMGSVSQPQAIRLCQGMGKYYDLITNSEWQTIARNIELVSQNWDENKVGSKGGLNHGHSDGVPPKSLPATSEDNNSCYKTKDSCDLKKWHSQRRTHILSNGQVIWDFAGNQWEWTKDINNVDYGYDAYMSFVTHVTHKNKGKLLDGVLRDAKDQFGPTNDYSKHISHAYAGLGQAWLNYKNGGVRRGGRWKNGPSSGVFTVHLMHDVSDKLKLSGAGFRCVYRP
ncbi:MAG: SUMF1/EgtB/PvdO family nonheme iron enzyme [Bdellovibrionaceae bacterium]|nr:SUMF1/EgtB/PvdO family nonheme iron enzyme [Pseudobdellovibrionaceae bacterium]